MTWNYRIVQHEPVNKFVGIYFDIAEVYYDDAGNIKNYAKGVSPQGDTPEELKSDLQMMLEAFDHPILTITDLPKSE